MDWKRRIRLALVVAALPADARAQALGSEFQVNTFTTSYQYAPRLTVRAGGGFVVVWNGYGQDGSQAGVFGRRYDGSGAPLGAELSVNVYTTNGQRGGDVASQPGGAFTVVWNSYGQDGSLWGILGRTFDASGAPLGGEFSVNTYTTGSQVDPRIAAAAGTFVVVWDSFGEDGSLWGVFGRRYDAAGVPLGDPFQVNAYTTGDQRLAHVASDPNGSFLVTWSSFGEDGHRWGIHAQRYDAAGTPQGAAFRVNSYTTDDQIQSSVAADASGNFVVVWSSYGQDGSYDGIFGQRLDASGSPLGPEFQVHTYTTDYQYAPSVATDATGSFVVVWASYGQDGQNAGVFGRRYDPAGNPVGGEFAVNTYKTDTQARPIVSSDALGRFVVAWQSALQDGSSYGVFAQRFSSDAKGDFSADAKTDVLFRHQVSGKNVVWFMDGVTRTAGAFTNPAQLPDTHWRIVGSPDFDFDHETDILFRHAVSGKNVVWFMDEITRTLGVFTNPDTLPDTHWQMVGTGDFDSDGKADILFRHALSGKNVVWYMDGITRTAGVFTNPAQLPDTNWQMVGVGDFSTPADGKTDIVFRHAISGKNVVWQMDGITRTAGVYTSPDQLPDTSWRIAAVGDYDGDSRADLLWRNFVSGKIVVWHMNGITRTAGVFANPASLPDTNWSIVGPR